MDLVYAQTIISIASVKTLYRRLKSHQLHLLMYCQMPRCTSGILSCDFAVVTWKIAFGAKVKQGEMNVMNKDKIFK